MSTRKLTNFAFDAKTHHLLESLAKRYSLSKTAIVQKALNELVQKPIDQKINILGYAGIISTDDADMILDTIEKDRHNKENNLVL